MRKSIIGLYVLSLSILATEGRSATVPSAVKQTAAKLKLNDVKTVITRISNKDENPCLPDGISYNVELKVKTAAWNGNENKVIYSWETAKLINVTRSGQITEVCAE